MFFVDPPEKVGIIPLPVGDFSDIGVVRCCIQTAVLVSDVLVLNALVFISSQTGSTHVRL